MVSFRNEMVGSNNNRVEDVTAGGQRLGCEYWHLFQWCNSGPVDMSNKIIYEMWCVACWCSTQLTLSLFLAELHRPSEKRLWCPPFLLLLNHSVVFHHPDGINPPVKAINGRGDWKSIHHLENPNRGEKQNIKIKLRVPIGIYTTTTFPNRAPWKRIRYPLLFDL